ncbi:hypothetical protein C8R43DRAFT_889629, partial [Mycena crocata]
LTNNEPPSETEVPFIRSIVETTISRLAHLDDEISRLQGRAGRLKELEGVRGSLSTSHAQNTAIISPLRRMPAEVLAEIFS